MVIVPLTPDANVPPAKMRVSNPNGVPDAALVCSMPLLIEMLPFISLLLLLNTHMPVPDLVITGAPAVVVCPEANTRVSADVTVEMVVVENKVTGLLKVNVPKPAAFNVPLSILRAAVLFHVPVKLNCRVPAVSCVTEFVAMALLLSSINVPAEL